MPGIPLSFMKEVNVEANAEIFSGIDRKGRVKKQKPLYKRCSWYPYDCDAVGCELGRFCPDFRDDAEA